MSAFTENTDSLRSLTTVAGDIYDGFELLSPSMKCLEGAIRDVGMSGLPVLILGEPGTGKRVLGLRIHQLSPRRDSVLVEADCTEEESEPVFQQVKVSTILEGGLTGTPFGTVVFHEVASLDPVAQGQLRQLLAEHYEDDDKITREYPKLIFTSHRNLEQEVRLGRFREDLYYQISKVCLRVPPLRHRKEDIVVWADRFVARYASLMHRPKPTLSESTIRFLLEYQWPGNLRELEDAARTIAAIGDDKVAVAALRTTQRTVRRQNGKAPIISLKEASRAASRAAEKDLILKVLSKTQWNRKKAAEELKISYKALLYKLKQIGMHDPESIAEREVR